MGNIIGNQHENSGRHSVIWQGFGIGTITEHIIAQCTLGGTYFDKASYQYIIPKSIDLNQGTFTNQYQTIAFPDVTVLLTADNLHLACTCHVEGNRLCEHQALVLTSILAREEFRIFFDDVLRYNKLKKFATDYGLENEPDLDGYFQVSYLNKRVLINPRSPGLIAVTRDSINQLRQAVLADNVITDVAYNPDQPVCVLLKQHKYYGYLIV